MPSVSSSALDFLHGKFVFQRRVRVLARALADCLPPNARVLDVGSGDGSVGASVKALRPDITIEGIDVLVRQKTAYPVTAFDGAHIPFPDASFDICMFVDVLHHTADPLVLLAEAARVAREGVVLKDHLREGVLAEETLRFMDWVGNARHGVVLPYNYLNELQWKAAFARAGLEVETWNSSVGLYAAPVDLVFGRRLHFVARLSTRSSTRPGQPRRDERPEGVGHA